MWNMVDNTAKDCCGNHEFNNAQNTIDRLAWGVFNYLDDQRQKINDLNKVNRKEELVLLHDFAKMQKIIVEDLQDNFVFKSRQKKRCDELLELIKRIDLDIYYDLLKNILYNEDMNPRSIMLKFTRLYEEQDYVKNTYSLDSIKAKIMLLNYSIMSFEDIVNKIK